MPYLGLLPVFLMVAAALVTVIGTLFTSVTPLLFIKRLLLSSIIFFLFGKIICIFILSENGEQHQGTGITSKAQQEQQFQELELPVVNSRDSDADKIIRGRG